MTLNSGLLSALPKKIVEEYREEYHQVKSIELAWEFVIENFTNLNKEVGDYIKLVECNIEIIMADDSCSLKVEGTKLIFTKSRKSIHITGVHETSYGVGDIHDEIACGGYSDEGYFVCIRDAEIDVDDSVIVDHFVTTYLGSKFSS